MNYEFEKLKVLVDIMMNLCL